MSNVSSNTEGAGTWVGVQSGTWYVVCREGPGIGMQRSGYSQGLGIQHVGLGCMDLSTVRVRNVGLGSGRPCILYTESLTVPRPQSKSLHPEPAYCIPSP